MFLEMNIDNKNKIMYFERIEKMVIPTFFVYFERKLNYHSKHTILWKFVRIYPYISCSSWYCFREPFDLIHKQKKHVNSIHECFSRDVVKHINNTMYRPITYCKLKL